ncbi:hypothetical protein KAR91_51045 [Candidatus Pacearchaeota archaeon]|nr:hypothetical protein [Candidatus Pacearchaeota archaeon]
MNNIVEGPGISKRSLGNARISFDIVKNTEQNKAKIRIYNLAERSRKFLNENDELGDIQVTLEVGYKQVGLKVLFIGDVERSTYKRVGPDWITELHCKDGGQAIQNVKLDKSYAGDVKVDIQTVVKDLVDQIKDKAKVNVDNVMAQIKQKVQSEKIDWGLNIQGLAMKTLRSLLGKQGKEVSIQDNNLEFAEPTEKESTKESAITISAETGMVGSPVSREKGIEFKALINPLLKPMGQISSVFINSVGFKSIYRVRSLKFKGDTHDNPWYMQGIAV